MATPAISPSAPAPDNAPDDASARFALLDMDYPVPALPAWAIAALAAIAMATSVDALEAVIAPVRAQPEGEPKATVRAAMHARHALIKAMRTAAPPSHTAPAPVAAPQVTPVAPAPVAATAVRGGRPMAGTYANIKSGPHRGGWGARIECHKPGDRMPAVGDVALIARKSGGSQPKRITGIVWTDGTFASICTIEDVPRNTPATTVGGTPVATSGSFVVPPMVHETTSSNDGASESLARDLTGIATEAASNATVADLGAQLSDSASSTDTRRLGVGFSTPGGYLAALQRGGLQPATRREYLAIVRAAGLAFDESTIPAANDESAGAPVGAGITHTPTGPSVFDPPKAQRTAQRAALTVGKSDKALSGPKLMKAGDLIGGAIAAGAGGEFGWEGSKSCTRGKLIEALATIDRVDDAPAAKDARAQIGRAVRTLANDYDVSALQGAARTDLPKGVSHAHIVCRKLTGSDISTAASGALGEVTQQILLRVYLHDDDTVTCDGDQALAARVLTDYDRRTADQVLISADLTGWLQQTLIRRHGASSYGRHWYVPGGQRDAAVALTRAVRSTGWGCRWLHGSTLTTEAAVIEGLTEGLADEIAAVEAVWSKAQESATEDRKAGVSTRTAASTLAKLIEVGERIRGYALLLGDEAIAPLRARVATLESIIRPLCDDTSARGSLLEFS